MLKKVLGMVAQQEDHITSHLANQAILELQNKTPLLETARSGCWKDGRRRNEFTISTEATENNYSIITEAKTKRVITHLKKPNNR
jgi:hypothetical protein